jgi:hypothetical protein
VLSKEAHKRLLAELEKKNKPIIKCQEELTRIIREKNATLKATGMNPLILSRAANQAHTEIRKSGALTEKQLQILYPAAILEAQETLLRLKEISEKKITERQLKDIFCVDRKTMRKWKKTLIMQDQIWRLRIHFRQKEQEREFGIIEFPTEVKSITKLETPYKGMCDFCETEKSLDWRIYYSNESWSDICTTNYEWLKDMSLKHGWETDRVLFLK